MIKGMEVRNCGVRKEVSSKSVWPDNRVNE